MRTRILEEATRLFTIYGYTGISMREIAEAVGVSKAGLYYHFKDKEDLFLAILYDALRRVEQVVTGAVAASPHARGQIEGGRLTVRENAVSIWCSIWKRLNSAASSR